ncbi:MAG: LPS export ABC transporter periplasmic protein LptC [Marinibacterium sp.]
MDSYSRRVAFLKITLPLAALGILSTLFLLSRGGDPNATIPFSDAEIAERVRDQQITAPRFAGSTDRGDQVFLVASKAVPGKAGEPGEAQNLQGEIRLATGGTVTFQSDRGRVNVPDDSAAFEGHVTITSDTGYILTTDQLTTAIRRVDAVAPGPVAGDGPLGRLTAGAMHLTAPDNDANQTHLRFTDGVKVVYHPKDEER